MCSGDALANMDTTGLTKLTALDNNDDGLYHFPVNLDFYFLGTNYGNGLNEGIYWNSNSVLGFGNRNLFDGYLGILIGYEDRLNNTFWYSNTLTASSGANYVRLLYFGQNRFSDGTPDVLQYEINIMRDTSFQYVEIRTAGIGETIGDWDLSDGINYQNTCGDFYQTTGPAVGGSYVFKSDLTGQNWEFYRNYHINK
jgi:hypothetical protein